MRFFLKLFLIILLFLPFNAFSKPKTSVSIEILNIPSINGSLFIALQKGLYYKKVDVTESSMSVCFPKIPFGKYLLSVFHDANNNWWLDKRNNIPVEYCGLKYIVVSDSTNNFIIRLEDQTQK